LGLPFSQSSKVFLGYDPLDCRFSLRSKRLPKKGSLTKAFQTNALRLFGFFNAHPLNQASLFRGFALKKPLICMRGFVERTGIEPVLPG
jgi:hypothetical protein